jgi:hypothetical protein
MGLEHALQELHEQGKQVEISWLWDGGIDVKAGDEERNFRRYPLASVHNSVN